MEKDTVAIYFVAAALAALAEPAKARVLALAGVRPELLADPAARVPAAAFAALWLAVARELDDEFFGLDARRMKVGSFALLCRSVLHCGDLGRALRQCLRGFALFLDDIEGELALQGEDAVLTLVNRIAEPAARRYAEETYLVMVQGLLCWLAGRRLPMRAEFAGAAPPHAAEYSVMYTPQLRFGARRTALRFDARLLAAPIVQTEATLKSFLRKAPQSVFLKYRNQDSWTARLRRRLQRSIASGDWPTLADAARECHIAPSTLRRRLESEGSSYQAIKDALRRDAAIHRLTQTRDSIALIAGDLGFQDASAFHRAFRKWSGAQPGEYRARRQAGI